MSGTPLSFEGFLSIPGSRRRCSCTAGGRCAMPRDAFAAEPPIGNWEERPASPSPLVLEFPVMAEEAFTGLAGDLVCRLLLEKKNDRAGLLLSAHACFGNC